MNDLNELVRIAKAAALGDYGVLSSGEKMAAALILNRPDWLIEYGYTIAQAMHRVGSTWMCLVPEAARIVEKELDEDEKATKRADIILRAAQLRATTQNPEEPIRFNSSLVTWSQTPGRRCIDLTMNLSEVRTKTSVFANILVGADDAEQICRNILDIHRFAWRNGAPNDRKPDEQRPTWF